MPDRAATRFARPRAPERVLQVADELFYGEGIHAVGVDRIAADADTSKATLYTHYGSKDGLVAAYLDRRTSRWREETLAHLERTEGDARAQLLSLFDALGEWHREDDFRGCAFINAGSELTDREHPGYAIGLRHRDWVRGLFAGLAAEAGADDAPTAAKQLLMLYDAATVTAYLDRDLDAARVARDVADRLIASWSTPTAR